MKTEDLIPPQPIIDRAFNVSWYLLWIGFICFAIGWWFGVFFWLLSFLFARAAVTWENARKSHYGD